MACNNRLQKVSTASSYISIQVEPASSAGSVLNSQELYDNESQQSLTIDHRKCVDNTYLQPLLKSRKSSRKAIIFPEKQNYVGKMDKKFGGKTTSRLFTKDGIRNMRMANVRFSMKTLVNSSFHKLVNMRWSIQLAFFSVSSIFSWLFFAFCWWSIQIIGESYGEQCVVGVRSFYSAVLFSVETQATIGYGSHYISNRCYPGFVVLYLQMVLGSILQSLLCAVVISKFAHPKFRRSDILFSDKICIHKENNRGDGDFVLSFRIADQFYGAMSMPEAHVRVYLIHAVEDEDYYGGNDCMVMQDLDVGYDKGEDRVLLMVPWVVQHVIDYNSPLFNKGYEDIASGLFEIVVILEGSVEETGSVTQCLKSYVAEDVLWGYTFDSMISKSKGKFTIDFGKLNSCSRQPDCSHQSAADLVSKKIATFARSSLDNFERSPSNIKLGGAESSVGGSRRKSVKASYLKEQDQDQEANNQEGVTSEVISVEKVSHDS